MSVGEPAVALHLCARAGSNGNPRGVYLVLDERGQMLAAVEEAGSGGAALAERFPQFGPGAVPVRYVHRIEVPVGEYRRQLRLAHGRPVPVRRRPGKFAPPAVRPPNEERADRGLRAIDAFTDRSHTREGRLGFLIDIADLVADLLHLAERYGYAPTEVLGEAQRDWEGDREDAPPVATALCSAPGCRDLASAGQPLCARCRAAQLRSRSRAAA